MTASNTVFTVFSGIGLVLSLVPLRWHLKSPIVGTSVFMIWTALACLVYFVDSILWSGNTINWAPVWCDIAIRVKIGIGVALPACSLCIVRRLYYITCTPTARREGSREIIVDLLIIVGIPVLQMIAEYTVSTNRFNIVEDFGCAFTTWNTPLVYALVWSWSLIIGVISACYGALTIHAFMKRRKQIKESISTNSSLTYDRCWRLIALSSADLCVTIPLSIWSIVSDTMSGFYPLSSWADIHRNYSHIIQVPRTAAVNTGYLCSYEITRWTPVFCAFLYFGAFGLTNEARRNYRLLASTIAGFFGLTMFTGSVSIPSSRVIDHSLHFAPPISVTLQTVSRGDSDSLSDRSTTVVDFENLSCPTAEQLTSASSMSLSIDEVPRIPEPALNPTLVRKSSVHSGNALNRV